MKVTTHEAKKRRRERVAIAVLSILFVVLTVFEIRLTRASNALPFVNSIFFFALLNLNIVLIIALLWLVFRNIGKLFFERRNRVLGARLKTKLVVAFLGFAIIPTIALFIISSSYINSSFDKWFSLKIQNTFEASLEITNNFYKNSELNSAHFASHLAKVLAERLAQENTVWDYQTNYYPPKWVASFLMAQRELLALNSVEYYFDVLRDRMSANDEKRAGMPSSYPALTLDLLERGLSGDTFSVVQKTGTGDLIRSVSPVRVEGSVFGVIVVNTSIPISLVHKKDEISLVLDDYKETNPLKYPIKSAYLILLVVITLVIIVVAIWMGLFLARELTDPVDKLVRAAREIGRGNLDVSLDAVGKDEIAVLVESFNGMTRDLRENRQKLTDAQTNLEKRTYQLEAVLRNIGTGVLVVDPDGVILTLNRAAAQLLEIQDLALVSKTYRQALEGDVKALVDLIERCLERDSQLKTAQAEFVQWNFQTKEGSKSLAAIATPLQEGGAKTGVIVVIEDMTHLVKGQREMAWREVARRIAHEIKNPLTPIKLSAQRLQRRMSDYSGKDGLLLRECTETIIRHTDELKEMVNEFSNFARLPEVNSVPNRLNEMLNEVVSLYQQAHPKIQILREFESSIPVFDFDRDQMKRVLINLFDNSIAAMRSDDFVKSKKIPVIKIESHFHERLQIAVINFEDNGPGMPEEVKNRVFEPYFSTKKEGTGLGLSIVKRIINDHDGFIRVYSTVGVGTQFVVELPTSPRIANRREREQTDG